MNIGQGLGEKGPKEMHSLKWSILECAAGKGMVFVLSVLNREI